MKREYFCPRERPYSTRRFQFNRENQVDKDSFLDIVYEETLLIYNTHIAILKFSVETVQIPPTNFVELKTFA